MPFSYCTLARERCPVDLIRSACPVKFTQAAATLFFTSPAFSNTWLAKWLDLWNWKTFLAEFSSGEWGGSLRTDTFVGKNKVTGPVPSGPVEDDRGMASLGHNASDILQMPVHFNRIGTVADMADGFKPERWRGWCHESLIS
ncbi:MAG: hypothetical protein OXC57_10035 [Rhodobacteraceae bacterium]|nr:hypothetical protein [Paracoccaceae bacterium]MCY4308597.1 hypothetical protein [Paracoccaceae bacterium]